MIMLGSPDYIMPGSPDYLHGGVMRQFFINLSISKVLKSLSGIVIMVLNDNDVSFICLINDDGVVIK